MKDGVSRSLNVLVVDDSAVVRQALSGVLSQESDMRVCVASDPLIAMEKMKKMRPDVIVLDLEMPRMDGLTFLRKIMSEDPIPVVVCSALASRGTEAALQALHIGAVEVVTKPMLGVQDFLHEAAVMLVDTIRAASRARLPSAIRGNLVSAEQRRKPTAPWAPEELAEHGSERVIAIGASTGGPEALKLILEEMPVGGPAVIIVQHMPEAFTAGFARHLNQTCEMAVKEARTGDRVIPGLALIAPGNRHMTLRRRGSEYVVAVRDGPLVSRHRPSVDVLFGSVAETAGPAAVGVLLTGMGSDGAEGLLRMRQAGAGTIVQDESSCVVFGMPREAIALGAAELVVPLPRVCGVILKRVGRRGPIPRAEPPPEPLEERTAQV